MNQTILGFIRKELVQALRDKRMRIVIFAIPIVQMTIFGLALSTEVRNVRLKVFFHPADVLARQVAERAFASGWFKPVTSPVSDPAALIMDNKADAVLVMPREGLTRAFERGEGRVQLLLDASNSIRARSVDGYLRAIIFNVAKERLGPDAPTVPLSFDARLLFNPSMRTPVYLVPGVMCMILCLLTIILTSMSMAREKELGTFEMLMAAPVKAWEILAGKMVPYILLGLADVPIIVTVAVVGFDVPLRGEIWKLGLASFVFVATTVSIGTLISTYARTQQEAMMGGFLFLFPAIQLSGVMAPLDNIPGIFKIVAAFNPLKYFVTLLRNIMLKGGDPSVFWPNILALFSLFLLAITVSATRFHRKLN